MLGFTAWGNCRLGSASGWYYVLWVALCAQSENMETPSGHVTEGRNDPVLL